MLFNKAALAALLVCANAEKFRQDPMHGHGPEWLKKIKEERESASDPEHIYVHMIAHSHDDVGWLKTVDEYYTGSKQDIAVASVESIISTVVEALIEDSRRMFTFVEMKFFSMWWDHQT